MRRAGMPDDWLSQPNADVTGEKFFAIWAALRAEANRPDMELILARAYAHGPFVPAVLSFSSSETVGLGLQRLTTYKPLVAPVDMQLATLETGLQVSFVNLHQSFEMPANLACSRSCICSNARGHFRAGPSCQPRFVSGRNCC